jgi:hypothetical protein
MLAHVHGTAYRGEQLRCSGPLSEIRSNGYIEIIGHNAKREGGRLSCLAYAISEIEGPSQPGKLAAIYLSIDFKRGVVESYHVESVRWNNGTQNGQISSR